MSTLRLKSQALAAIAALVRIHRASCRVEPSQVESSRVHSSPVESSREGAPGRPEWGGCARGRRGRLPVAAVPQASP